MSDLRFSGAISSPWLRILQGVRKPAIELQNISAEWHNIPLIGLEAYQRICGFEVNPEGPWPMSYPQVLLTPLHMQLIAQPSFPFPGLGLVHVRQVCEQYQPIVSPKNCIAMVRTDNYQMRKKGAEIDIISEIYDDDVLIWSAVTTVFSRKAKGHGQNEIRPKIPNATDQAHSETWSLSSDLGRRYTKVSGDFNPIHLYAWSAKLFGFKKAIIHGMWSMAHALSKLPPHPAKVTVHFIRPVELPSQPKFVWDKIDSQEHFWIHHSHSDKVCLWGNITF